MILVDRVATISMDSRGGLGTDFGATAIWSEIVWKVVRNATLP